MLRTSKSRILLTIILSISRKPGNNALLSTISYGMLTYILRDYLSEGLVMNKAELVGNVATATGLAKKDATRAVDAVFSSIQASLAKGEKVQLIGFGNFEVRNRAARKGRNPQTGAEIQIPASKVPAFKPGKALKDAVK